jgi:hypothetical protein
MPNSPANPLPIAFCGPNSAAGGLGQIVPKLLIYNILLMLRGIFSGAERRFSPADRERRWGESWPDPALGRIHLTRPLSCAL